MTIDLHAILDSKWTDETRPAALYEAVVALKPKPYVSQIVEGLSHKVRKVQNGCAELASMLSEAHPHLLIASRQIFIDNLTSPAKIVRWEAVSVLGNLAAIDVSGEVLAQAPRLFPMLKHDGIVLQLHALRALCKFAVADPDLAPAVLAKLQNLTDFYPGNRVGFLLEAAAELAPLADAVELVSAWIRPYTNSEVKSVARKASKALRELKRKQK